MNNKNFVHLHNHSEQSILDGYGTIPKIIKQFKKMGFHYAAITDHGNINGAIQWQIECEKQNINPVIGCEAYIVPQKNIKQKEKRGHITIWVKNRNGWANLCRMLTVANLEGFYYRPRIDYNLLLNHTEGLIFGTACAGSFLSLPNSENILKELHKKTDVYFEIMPHQIKPQTVIHNKIKELSQKYPKIPFVVTNDCHWILPEDTEAQEVLLAIQQKKTWDDPKRWKFGFNGLHIRTANEMIQAFKKQGHWPEDIVLEGMKNTIRIARQCFRFRIPKQEVSLPLPPRAQQGKEIVLLDAICKEGYEKIFGNDDWPQEYKDRYLHEIKLIKKRKFERYFLIVYDLIQWAEKNNISCGPGRGSSAGSLISFLTNITRVDPVKFKLSFSRFINDERKSLPDIDIDVEKRHRGKVVQYLKDTYGEFNTCSISTTGKMKSKAAVRDVCRVLEVPLKDVNIFVGSIWSKGNNDESPIENSLKNSKEGKYFAKKHPKATKLSLKLEGQARQKGVHAAAVIISKDDLRESDRCVLEKRGDRIACNWEMKDAEATAMLLKLDVLGLSTLSVLSEAKKLINSKDNLKRFYYYPEKDRHIFLNIMKRELEEKYKNCEQVDFDFNKISLEDEKVFKMLSEGNTSGVFQLSGYACVALCKEMKIHSFNDIVAINALARPGPSESGVTEEFVARKHGKKWKPMHSIYEDVTKDTYGLPIFQEQIMQIISRVAGLSESIADKIRKVIGKKRSPEEFKPFWEQFAQGCKKTKTLSEKEAEVFWGNLLKWAGYGFSINHAVPYSLIGHWTAFLKAHCFKEFASASLTFAEWNEKSRDDNKHKNSLLSEIRQAGYTIVPPKQKYSDAVKWQFHGDKLYIPFIEITGIGEGNAVKCFEPVKIKQNRLQGFFGTEYDISEKQDTKISQLLKELKVNDVEAIPSNKILKKYLPYIDFQGNETEKYPNLIKTVGSSIPEKDLDDFLTLQINPGEVQDGLIQRKRFRLEKQILQCNRCGLRKQVKKGPVLSSVGLYNIAIVMESPGEKEDEESKGAVGPAGNVLWEELAEYGYNRRVFHVTNCCHCWPSVSKTPTQTEISACYKWLHYELTKLNCKLILATGNVPLYALADRKSGIQALSGTTEWIENIGKEGAWVCFCIHPSAVLRNPSNRIYFEKGIKNFTDKLELLR